MPIIRFFAFAQSHNRTRTITQIAYINIVCSLFALCNLFSTSKKLRFFALRGARPVGLGACLYTDAGKYPRFVVISNDSSACLFPFN